MSNGEERTQMPGFVGSMLLTEADTSHTEDGWVFGYYGYVEIEPATVTGMEPARGESRWVARVSGPENTVWVPGCKVASVSTAKPTANSKIWRVT